MPVLAPAQSQLPITYLRKDQMEAWMHDPPVPFEDRSDAPVYVQSNCITPSRRDVTISQLMKFADLGIKSFGRHGSPFQRTCLLPEPDMLSHRTLY